MTGKLFIFEGPDGVGKTTIVNELKVKFRGDSFAFLSFPGRDEGTLGNTIYRIHHAPEEFGIAVISELARQTLHVAAHIDVIETRIKPWIAQGKNVALDRFWWSTLVYGGVGGVEKAALEQLIVLEKMAWGNIKPAVAFLIDRDSPIDRRENLIYWQAIRDGYAHLSERENEIYQVLTVRNTGSVHEAVEKVKAGIDAALVA